MMAVEGVFATQIDGLFPPELCALGVSVANSSLMVVEGVVVPLSLVLGVKVRPWSAAGLLRVWGDLAESRSFLQWGLAATGCAVEQETRAGLDGSGSG